MTEYVESAGQLPDAAVVLALATTGQQAAAVSGVNAVPTKDGNLTPYGVYQVTVTSTAQTLAQLLAQANTVSASGTGAVSTGIPADARIVWVIPATAGVNFSDDGGAPTATYGIPISAGQAWPVETSISALKLILQGSATTANLWFLG